MQSTRAGDRSDLCRLMSRVKQKPNCCQQRSEPATVCQNVDAGPLCASLAEHPDTLRRRQKIKPKQNRQKKSKIEEQHYVAYKAINCKMEILHAVISGLVQSVKLGAVNSNAI